MHISIDKTLDNLLKLPVLHTEVKNMSHSMNDNNTINENDCRLKIEESVPVSLLICSSDSCMLHIFVIIIVLLRLLMFQVAFLVHSLVMFHQLNVCILIMS